MRIAKQFGPYNEAHYARPWIAKVVAWQVGRRAELAWGTYLGNAQGGEAEIDAEPGDVVLYGQKGRTGRQGLSVYGHVTAEGAFVSCSEATAAKMFRTTILKEADKALTSVR